MLNSAGPTRYGNPMNVRDVRSAVAALAAVLAGGLAAFVLTNPRTDAWAILASEREIDRWVESQPLAIAAGVVAAPIVVAGLGRLGVRRIAWFAAAVATAVLCGAVAAVPSVGGVDALLAVNLVKAIAAGVLLGSVIAALWTNIARFALVLGVLVGVATASAGIVIRASGYVVSETTSSAGEPPWWLLIATIVVCAAALIVADDVPVIRENGSVLAAAVFVSVGAVLLHLLLASWIDNHAFGSGIMPWVVVSASLILVCLGVGLAANQVGKRGGLLIVAATGTAASASILFQDLRHPLSGASGFTIVLVTAIAGVAGVVAAYRWPRPEWGMALLAVIPLAAAIEPEFGTSGVLLVARLALFSIGAGLALGASLPDTPIAAALGFGMLFVSFAFAAIVRSTRTLAGPEAIRDAPAADLAKIPRFEDSWGSYLGAAAILIVVLFCVFMLVRQRKVDSYESAVDDAQSPVT